MSPVPPPLPRVVPISLARRTERERCDAQELLKKRKEDAENLRKEKDDEGFLLFEGFLGMLFGEKLAMV